MSHISWAESRELTYETARVSKLRAVEELELSQAIGAVLASTVASPISLPHYASSAMDGFAVAGASPWQVLLPEETDDPTENLHRRTVSLIPGQATPILTGGLIPEGASAVVREEHTRYVDSLLCPHDADPVPGADIRPAGEEVRAGDILIEAGTLLTPRHIALLAVAGLDRVQVHRRPRVACAFTGNEVVEHGIPAPGEVRDAYSPQFPHVLRQMGAEVISAGRLHDDMAEVRRFFEGVSAEIILATGGSANSEVDILRRYLLEEGARFIYESILVRPGHPTLLAELADGRLVLGLPGNPLAAHTSLYSLAPALISGWTARPLPPLARATALGAVPAFAKTSTRLLPCLVDGEEVNIFTRATSSHMLSALASGNGLAVVPPDGVKPGDAVAYIALS